MMNVFADIGPYCDVVLHTQTWSHVAVRMYHRLGFHMVRTEDQGDNRHAIDFDGAIEVLKGVMDAETIRELIDTAI